MLPWSRLRVEDGHNPRSRFDAREIDYLAATIRDRGLLQPILVRSAGDGSGRYVVIAGERRYRAIGRLVERGVVSEDWSVPVVVRGCGRGEALVDALIENVQRSDLDPIDEAEAFAALRDEQGMSTAEIGRVLGLSRRTVQVRLQLLRLVGEVRAALRSGVISLDVARVLAGAPPEAQLEALRRYRQAPPERRSAEAVRAHLRARAIPFSYALFDPKVYTRGHQGPVFDGGTAGRYFTDRELFVRLQRDALATLRAELVDEHEWVELVDGYRLPEGYETVENGPGAVILLKTGVFEVEVVRSVRRLEEGSGEASCGVGALVLEPTGLGGSEDLEGSVPEGLGASSTGAGRWRSESREQAAALQDAVASRPETALRLAITALLCPGGGCGLRLELAPALRRRPGVSELPSRVARALRTLAQALGLGDSGVGLVVSLSGRSGPRLVETEVYRRLARLPTQALERIHAALVAVALGGRGGGSPLLAQVAGDLGVAREGREGKIPSPAASAGAPVPGASAVTAEGGAVGADQAGREGEIVEGLVQAGGLGAPSWPEATREAREGRLP